MKREFFGTDGVRGEFGGAVINPRFARRLGVAAGRWLARHKGEDAQAKPVVLIGRDTRFSGSVLERALADGFAEAGISARSLGVVPTPAVSFAVRHFRAALGVVVTASHNPASDNGIKFFSAAGIKLDDADEAEIESLLPRDDETPASAIDETRPAIEILDAAVDAYLERLAAILPANALAGWRIVVDTANGAAHRTTPALLRRLGAELTVLADRPDGRNINLECGSQHTATMCRRVVETRARLGFAHDGDADRVIFADETGAEVDGDELLAILAAHAMQRDRLRERTLVATVQSNLGLKRFMEQAGGRLVQTAVGDRYVVEAMLAGGFNLGGENSGHIIATDVAPCGDGLAAALLVLAAMIDSGRPLSELRRGLRKFPQLTRALRVARKPELATLPHVQAAIRAAETRLASDGRVLVRYSGTEPKIRLLVEGPESQIVADEMAALEKAVREDLSEN
jgi:phosphoglucosamine mutase